MKMWENVVFGLILVLVFCGFYLLLVGHFSSKLPYDDSDNGTIRSGFTVMTDNLTGCQYLYLNGAMQPRFDQNGKQICKKEQK